MHLGFASVGSGPLDSVYLGRFGASAQHSERRSLARKVLSRPFMISWMPGVGHETKDQSVPTSRHQVFLPEIVAHRNCSGTMMLKASNGQDLNCVLREGKALRMSARLADGPSPGSPEPPEGNAEMPRLHPTGVRQRAIGLGR